MRPVWLIEAGVYGAEADLLIDEIQRQDLVAEVVPHSALRKDATLSINGRTLADDDCVIGYGTFPFARQIQLHRRWIPGAWCDSQNLDCTSYFAYFGKYLLNQTYAILPGVEAIRQVDWLFKVFGKDGRLFARPSGCHKLFIGRCIARDEFATALAPTRYDPTTLIVVAEPKQIGLEWRLVVAEGKVISGSQYAKDGSKAISPNLPQEVRAYTEAMLADVRWQPDPMFMLDLCQADGQLWLVELNGFSNSWLYQCDLAAIVKMASELAIRSWEKASSARSAPQ